MFFVELYDTLSPFIEGKMKELFKQLRVGFKVALKMLRESEEDGEFFARGCVLELLLVFHYR